MARAGGADVETALGRAGDELRDLVLAGGGRKLGGAAALVAEPVRPGRLDSRHVKAAGRRSSDRAPPSPGAYRISPTCALGYARAIARPWPLPAVSSPRANR